LVRRTRTRRKEDFIRQIKAREGGEDNDDDDDEKRKKINPFHPCFLSHFSFFMINLQKCI
jgi:hypothetical protein